MKSASTQTIKQHRIDLGEAAFVEGLCAHIQSLSPKQRQRRFEAMTNDELARETGMIATL